ncbi:MAG: serine protease [Lachnospiraceae bacterium]|nr:serine protease [Lachnospiraceae bacterium]
MDEKKTAENGEYQFIREKIISKKKSRVKKVILVSIGTVILAFVFGAVARLAFMATELPIAAILGLTPTATSTPTPTRAPVIPVTDKPTNTPPPTPTPNEPPATPTEAPSATPTEVPVPTEPLDPVTDPVNAFKELYEKLGDIARKALKSLVEVDIVKIETDWFGEPLESSTSVCGVVIGDDGVEYLVLVPASEVVMADRVDVTIGKTVVSGTAIIASDAEFDFAILSVPLDACTEADRKTVEYASFGGEASVKAGDPVIAVGSPNGYFGTYDFSMITNTGNYAYVTDDRFEIYTTNRYENSFGSGIFINYNGEMVGIMTHLFKEEMNEGITTMIATDGVADVIGKLANGTPKNYLGVQSMETPANVLKRLEVKYGLYVMDVNLESPAETAGIKKGDILIKFEGKDLKTVDSLHELLNSYEAGTEVEITLIRNTKPETVTVVIGER